MRTLVVYYSRSGTTRALAGALSRALDADVEEIVDETPRDGVAGYAQSLIESVLEQDARIRPRVNDPGFYDLVVVGTPVWAANVSSPVRAYLRAARGRLPSVAFFCTMGGRGDSRVFHKMQELAGARPVARLALRGRALWRPTEDAVQRFAMVARAAAEPEQAPEPRPVAVAAE